MIHRLFTAASAVSLLLCIGTVLLWARSYRFDQSLTMQVASERLTIRYVRGHLAAGSFAPANHTLDEPVPFWEQTPLLPDEETDLEWAISDEPSATKSVSQWFGCHLTKETVTGDVERWAEVPARSAVMLFGVMPLLWFAVAWLRRRRHASKKRRPECGTPVTAAS